MKRISLKQAVSFHGHLGPYLVIGLLMGEYALRRLKATRYFGLEAKVWGALKKPKSCLIDGLQLSTGCTYGKGNITKYSGENITASFTNRENKKKVSFRLKGIINKRLDSVTSHQSAESLARKLYLKNPEEIFKIL